MDIEIQNKKAKEVQHSLRVLIPSFLPGEVFILTSRIPMTIIDKPMIMVFILKMFIRTVTHPF